MTNKLGPLSNAELTWQVASGYTVDSATGNYVAASSGVTYYAALKPSTNPSFNRYLGAEETAFVMEGRLTNPLVLSGITPGATATAVINGREGRFELLPNEAMIEHYKQFLGAPIRGIFRLIGEGSVSNA